MANNFVMIFNKNDLRNYIFLEWRRMDMGRERGSKGAKKSNSIQEICECSEQTKIKKAMLNEKDDRECALRLPLHLGKARLYKEEDVRGGTVQYSLHTHNIPVADEYDEK